MQFGLWPRTLPCTTTSDCVAVVILVCPFAHMYRVAQKSAVLYYRYQITLSTDNHLKQFSAHIHYIGHFATGWAKKLHMLFIVITLSAVNQFS